MYIGGPLQAGQLVELNVTHIDESGKVYAQLNSLAKSILSGENISQICTNTVIVKAINFTKTYLVKWNSQLYRARVTDMPDEQKVMVFLIDFGRTVLISREDIFYANSNSLALQYIPPQVGRNKLFFFSLNLDSLFLQHFVKLNT